MVRARRWAAMGAGVVGLLAGCQGAATDRVAVSLTQTPPTVQAAFYEDHPGTVIRSVARETRGGERFYVVDYQDDDGAKHGVVYNGAGNEIDKH